MAKKGTPSRKPAKRKATPQRKPAKPASRERRPRTPPVAAHRKLERVRMPPSKAAAPPAASTGKTRPTTQTPAKGEASQVAASDPNEGRYVYCIIRSGKPIRFGALGLGVEPTDVYTVHYKDIAAVISNTPMVVPDPTGPNVLAHQRVNETVMQHHTVIPMSFGTLFKTDHDIAELLRSAYDAFSDVLTKMHGKVEFGLKVLWDREQIIREIEEEEEGIRRLKSEISSQKGSTYFARMQYGRLIDAALQSRIERYVSEIFSALYDVSVGSRSNKPIGDRTIMNAAFLVTRDAEPAFEARLKEIGQRYDTLTFKYTGPWPPYNFVNIRLKLERAQ